MCGLIAKSPDIVRGNMCICVAICECVNMLHSYEEYIYTNI